MTNKPFRNIALSCRGDVFQTGPDETMKDAPELKNKNKKAKQNKTKQKSASRNSH